MKNALPHLRNGSVSWNPSLNPEADALQERVNQIPEKTFAAAIDAEAYTRGLAFVNGVKAYHAHPYQRDVTNPPATWSEGGSNLLDYGGPDDGPVMLAVPSLINKAYILDLNKERSFMRSMAESGIRSFLLEWGDVGIAEKKMGLEDYILGRLNRCVNEVIRITGRPVCLVGYCMGGVLTTALSIMEPEKVAGLILMATPWDFHGGSGDHERLIKTNRQQLESTIKMTGELPIDVIQSLFAAIDPYSILRKFENFSLLDTDSAEAKKFVAMEDWLNDAVPLSGPVAEECLFDWYIENLPGTGRWEMDGHRIDPSDITCPSLVFVPEQDRIVAPESAHALGNLIPNARTEKVQAGHIGMVTGRKALGSLYHPLSKWLLSQDF
ncbi:alpha/beta fold hydrolase [Terasakiella sp. A23]|uniref:alpha/beta fold hydrolase n=1 Tax=Terasakiella sp. FCG-A23 TaxID=3080561 RepID=UPI002952A70D|nr:alpha/beta fold hydrolase [Terasakiella sp. A23]MDV7339661.1 alpha/beta fold hydrolase [Terasakiella sp. A23]